MSGHSKWAQIKRAKGANDVKRGQLFTKLGREITIAAREGGADPDGNARLRMAIDRAREANMPMDTIQRAIQRGVGGGEGAALEEVVYEAYGAGGFGLTLEQMRFVWRHYVPHEIDLLHPLASPLRAELAGLPPVLLILPEMDVLRSEGEAMAAKLEAAGVKVRTEVIEGVVHGFLRGCGSVQGARDALNIIANWTRETTH